MRRETSIAWLLAFYLLCYIVPLGGGDLIIPDETRYGEIPREMIERGDWVSPRSNGVRYFEKPILGYWLHAASIGMLGENTFAVRFPSALAAGLSAMTIYCLIRFGLRRNEGEHNAQAGYLAAMVYLSTFGVFAIGNIALLDSLFSFFTAASLVLLYFAVEPGPDTRRKYFLAVTAGICCALSTLTKGFVGIAIPVFVFLPYMIWTKRFAGRSLRIVLIALLAAVLAAMPWGILVHLREPDFWRFFFWNEHIKRFLLKDAQHARSFLFFFIVAPFMLFPWSFLAPAAFMGEMNISRKSPARKRLIAFCLCWFVFPFLFFFMFPGKIAHIHSSLFSAFCHTRLAWAGGSRR